MDTGEAVVNLAVVVNKHEQEKSDKKLLMVEKNVLETGPKQGNATLPNAKVTNVFLIDLLKD